MRLAITSAGGYATPAIARAKERAVPPEEVMRRVLDSLALAIVRGPGAEDPPFEEYAAIEPGSLDLRVFDQEKVWVDALRDVHQIDDRADLTDAYLTNLVAFLEWEAGHFASGYWMAFGGDIEIDPRVWLEGTVLMRRLREEVMRRCL
ncbi:hypothetical protein [Nocardioides jiangxiensis]|uniref:CdiI immunity protein domain-containing protein n=1 Tax=Nocardioides jiangxiensis TaxID=3064524 RepID=A0ABT9B175_9ACTN|nr:hypothetical protein [Nocardioides sp. WY-20]MDO7868155.1 hypothetical protein [Nocardioides sp. WY-20]